MLENLPLECTFSLFTLSFRTDDVLKMSLKTSAQPLHVR